MLSRSGLARLAAVALAAAVVLAAALPAEAHSLKLWVRVAEGRTLKGRAYFPGGGRAKGVTVEVFDPAGAKLGSAETDDEGEFTYEAAQRCDHTFVVRTMDGHGDTAVVRAEYLPADLPGGTVGGASATAGAAGVSSSAPTARGDTDAPTGAPASTEGTVRAAELERAIDGVVARWAGQMMDKITEYEDRQRLHDVLGGIGYIVGATGIVFYLLARHRKP